MEGVALQLPPAVRAPVWPRPRLRLRARRVCSLPAPSQARVSLSGLRAYLLERGRMLGRLEARPPPAPGHVSPRVRAAWLSHSQTASAPLAQAAHPDDLDIALGSHLSGPFEPLRSVSKLSGAVVLRVTASERRETAATRRDESRGRSGTAHESARGKPRPVPKNKLPARRPRERRVAGARFETVAQHDDDSSSD